MGDKTRVAKKPVQQPKLDHPQVSLQGYFITLLSACACAFLSL
jgi:hypothetical protein